MVELRLLGVGIDATDSNPTGIHVRFSAFVIIIYISDTTQHSEQEIKCVITSYVYVTERPE